MFVVLQSPSTIIEVPPIIWVMAGHLLTPYGSQENPAPPSVWLGWSLTETGACLRFDLFTGSIVTQ